MTVGEPSLPRRHRPTYATPRLHATSPAYPTVTLPANEGALTEPLSNQKRLIWRFVAASLRAGLVPSDAVTRATDAVRWIRDRAIEYKYDSEEQQQIAAFVTACMQAPGVENGITLASRGIEAARLLKEWRKGVRKVERDKARRGEVQ